MDSLIIQGGTRLKGKVEISGSKNSSLPIVAAALMTTEKLTLHGVPATGRVRLVTPEPDLNGLPQGSVLHLNLISGHRDANSTDCPGSALYAERTGARQQLHNVSENRKFALELRIQLEPR